MGVDERKETVGSKKAAFSHHNCTFPLAKNIIKHQSGLMTFCSSLDQDDDDEGPSLILIFTTLTEGGGGMC